MILPASAASTNTTECTETLSDLNEVFFDTDCLCTEHGDEGIQVVSEYMDYFMGGTLSSWVRDAPTIASV